MKTEITLITGTNRTDSNSELVALEYAKVLRSKGCIVSHIYLKDMPSTFAFSEMFGNRSSEFEALMKEKIVGCEKFVFIIPEYNGSFPGVLKTFIDALPPSIWNFKKAGLIGLSSGKSGALRATDHFSSILNYLKVNVYFQKPKLAGIESMLNNSPSSNAVIDFRNALETHADGLLAF